MSLSRRRRAAADPDGLVRLILYRGPTNRNLHGSDQLAHADRPVAERISNGESGDGDEIVLAPGIETVGVTSVAGIRWTRAGRVYRVD